ncbi:MAG: alpha/beta hydrolase [Actinomycetota bacterium]
MTKVFVHGNPEVAEIWGPLVDALGERGVDDCVALSPPGFGAPVPAGFEATPAGYVDWLAGELTGLGGTIDLVGHDWGAGHVFGLAARSPGLIRSWAADCAGLLHPSYEWHDAAQTWRTPGAGEQSVADLTDLPVEELTAAYAGLGMPPEIAGPMADAANEEMGACILTLYRAADRAVLDEVARALATADRPALLLSAEADPYVGVEFTGEVAAQLGAAVAPMPDLGHWWMVQDPTPAADALARFWASLD